MLIILLALAVYGLIMFLSNKKFAIAYVDKYKQLVETTKMNCPNELYEMRLVKSADKNFSGKVLGFIYGKNYINFYDKPTKTVKWYHMFVISAIKKRWYNPLTWAATDKLVVAEQENVSIGNNYDMVWRVGGINYQGFYMFAAEGNLTPQDIIDKTFSETGFQEAVQMAKRQSKLVEESVEGNPNIKQLQKTTRELPEKE